jgi:anti-sigma-K factor RskA
MDHSEIKNLLPLKALDRLEGEEARAVDEHLAAGCDECQRELAELIEALSAFALAEVGDGPTEHRIWDRLQSRLVAPSSLSRRDEDRSAQRIEDRARRDSSRRPYLTIVGSVAVAAIVAFAIANFETSRVSNMESQTTRIAALQARIDALQRALEVTGERVAVLQSKIDQTTNLTLASLGPEAHVVPLAPLKPAPGAAGMVALNSARSSAILQVEGLPPIPDDKIYEVWWIGAKKGPLKAGLFEPQSNGPTIVSLEPPPRGETILASAITLEPRGGVDEPTGEMYLKGDFPHR